MAARNPPAFPDRGAPVGPNSGGRLPPICGAGGRPTRAGGARSGARTCNGRADFELRAAEAYRIFPARTTGVPSTEISAPASENHVTKPDPLDPPNPRFPPI